ncbi:MAG: T9SS type A sorting domain-containing protein [Bacteroidia bacterium]
MKGLYKLGRILSLLLLFSIGVDTSLNAQIFEPEGLNLPGEWNDFTNPPEQGSVFGSATQVNGQVTPITVGQKRWQTTVHIAETSADTSAGTYAWLFTSGSLANPYGNKWAGVNVAMNTIQNYQYNAGDDNTITVENDKYYTINWEDVGYAPTRAIVMETSAQPVNFISLDFLPQNPTSAEVVNVSVFLESNPSPEEFFYLRYSTDDYNTSEIIPLILNGTELNGEIPAQLNDETIVFYVFSSTIENPVDDIDLISLNFINDLGESFQYTVQDEVLTINIGEDFSICPGLFTAVIDAGLGFDSYQWSTGDVSSSILIDGPGQYSVEVSLNGLIARDTIIVTESNIPSISLGSDISLCSNAPIELSAGVSIGNDGNLLTIIYDATQGVSGLTGASTVYMHSTYEAVPFGGPVLPFVGNWGEDDGLGQMTNIGEDLWSITINPFIYYSISEDITSISGLFMVFRNADGTEEGKDENGNDIFLNLQGADPVSSFSGISASYQQGGYESIQWSSGDTTETIIITESGLYSATVTTTDGCVFTDEIEITLGDFIAPDLPAEVFICGGTTLLDAGIGYDFYLWSTGQTSAQIEVSESGVYTVTVGDGEDCSASDSTIVTVTSLTQFSLGNDTTVCGNINITLSTGLSISSAGDSLTIRYDASQGIGDLEGASSVYMHSGIALTPQGMWNNVVGNWGQDDGIGEMQADANFTDVWTITFNPYSYYGIEEGSDFSGIWMVFRNSDGTLTGKNELDQDIYINTTAYPSLASAFGGLTASVQSGEAADLIWSTGETSASIVVNESGLYWAEIGQGNCTFRDSVNITFISVPELELSADTAFCGSIEPFIISASAGFDSYLWNNGETSNEIEISESGTYILTAGIETCSITDSVRVQNNIADGDADLGPDAVICGTTPIVLSPGITISPIGDSLTIVYDATQGQSGLAGANKVYMHSSFEYMPFGGPVIPFVGNWGEDDGLGEMTNIGENLWSITINIYNYYSINPDSLVNGLFMVFRNADGSAEGKDDNGNDIFLSLLSSPPASEFSGVTASLQSSGYDAILWSTGEITPTITVSQPGEYSVVLFGLNGCNATDTILVTTAPLPNVNLGSNQILCNGESTSLSAGPGFSSYLWSNGSTSQTVDVNSSGNYSVTVTNAEGCEAFDSVGITESVTPNASFTWLESIGLTINFTYTGTGQGQFAWDFDSDGNIDNTNVGSATFTYPEVGQYEATLIVSNTCGSDTTSVQLNLIGLNSSDIGSQGIKLFPNPASTQINISIPGSGNIRLISPLGQVIEAYSVNTPTYQLSIENLASGIYFLEYENSAGKQLIRFIKN